MTTILVIDDSEDDQHLYRRALKDAGYGLQMASTAKEGFERIADAQPDLILLDFNLPDMDGLSFMKRLAEYSDTPTPIIMLTGEGGTAVAVEAIKNGADDYLVKDTEGQYLRILPEVARRVMSAYAQREQTRRLQKETEALLRRNQILMQNSMDAIHVKDLQGNLVEANDAFCQMLGYSREEIAHLNVADWDAQWTIEELRERFKWLIGKHVRFETVQRRKDGTLINVEISSSSVEIEGQHYLFATSRDITERKKAEEALRVAAVAFETHDAIMITDAEANIVKVNRAFSDVTGYSAEEVLGKNPRIMSSGRQDRTFYTTMWQKMMQTGTWSGEVFDKRKNGQVYPAWMTITAVKNEQQETTHYVAIFSDITERKKIEEEIRNMAFYDALTNLPNRRLFLDRFRAALPVADRHRHYGAVLFIDLDRFKIINDTLGHDYGDLLLVEVAGRIKTCVREIDTVARMGGDEFVVLIAGLSEDEMDAKRKVEQVAEKIRMSLAAPYQLRELEHHSSPSIGISLYRGIKETVEGVLQQADLAMYEAKKSGRNAVRFFDPAMKNEVE